MNSGAVHRRPSGIVKVKISAVVIKADGTTKDLGVICVVEK